MANGHDERVAIPWYTNDNILMYKVNVKTIALNWHWFHEKFWNCVKILTQQSVEIAGIYSPHTVEITQFYYQSCLKNFAKLTYYLRPVLNNCFDGKNLRLVFPHCALTLFWQKFRQSNFFTKESTKSIGDLTKFFFSENSMKKYQKMCSRSKNFVKLTFQWIL